jgi:uncharacterized membrane protein (UPF0127 family)
MGRVIPGKLIVRETGREAVPLLEVADGFWGRFIGLEGRARLEPGRALLLVPCRGGIHTWGMRFTIDVFMLARTGRVLGVEAGVRPWSLVFPPRGTHAVLEAAAGGLAVPEGAHLAWRPDAGGGEPPHSLDFLR